MNSSNITVTDDRVLENLSKVNNVLNNDKNYFKVEKDGEIINSTLVNDLEEVEVPNTNLNRNYTKYIISLSIGLVGLGIILYEKKKRK